jgi:hypothetical protein
VGVCLSGDAGGQAGWRLRDKVELRCASWYDVRLLLAAGWREVCPFLQVWSGLGMVRRVRRSGCRELCRTV